MSVCTCRCAAYATSCFKASSESKRMPSTSESSSSQSEASASRLPVSSVQVLRIVSLRKVKKLLSLNLPDRVAFTSPRLKQPDNRHTSASRTLAKVSALSSSAYALSEYS